MSDPGPSDRWVRATGAALGRRAALGAALDRRHGEPLAPGDVFVVPATRAYPVEWMVVERAGPRLLVVPADTNPLFGTGDLRVPAGAPSGPLALRCREALWVKERALVGASRTGAVSTEYLEQARRRRQALEAGVLEGEALEEEVGADPEYQDWIAELVAGARSALAAAAGAGTEVAAGLAPARAWPVAPWALAASFALATVGLAVWVVLLRGEVDRLSEPLVNVPTHETAFGSGTRGVERIDLEAGATHLLLVVILGEEVTVFDEYRLELVDPSGRRLWQSGRLAGGPAAEYNLVLPRRLLGRGEVRLRLHGLKGDQANLLEERRFVVEGGVGGR